LIARWNGVITTACASIVVLLFDHGKRIKKHKARQVSCRAGQRPAAELGEDVFLWGETGRHDSMAGLGPAVVTYHGMRGVDTGQEIDDRAFARIAKAKIHS